MYGFYVDSAVKPLNRSTFGFCSIQFTLSLPFPPFMVVPPHRVFHFIYRTITRSHLSCNSCGRSCLSRSLVSDIQNILLRHQRPLDVERVNLDNVSKGAHGNDSGECNRDH